MINNRKDILLLLLYSPGCAGKANEPIVGRTRLVKMLYLFKKEAMEYFRKGTEIDEDSFYCFYAWNFGPFSTEVYDDITFFLLRGFVQSSISESQALPESEAEWEQWSSRSGVATDENVCDEYNDEEFQLTKKGLRFTEELYDTLTRSQKTHLREFKVRTSAAPLRALLRYVYSNYPDDATQSQIKDEVLHGADY